MLPFGLLSKTALLKATASVLLLFRLLSTSCGFTPSHYLSYSLCPLKTVFTYLLTYYALTPSGSLRALVTTLPLSLSLYMHTILSVIGFFFYPEDRSNRFFQNFGKYLPKKTSVALVR
jgi:hypothetical protein